MHMGADDSDWQLSALCRIHDRYSERAQAGDVAAEAIIQAVEGMIGRVLGSAEERASPSPSAAGRPG